MSRSRSSAVVLVALRYLAGRRFATLVSVGAIALSLLLVIGIGLVNFAIKKTAVEGAIRYPLIIGPEGTSAVQLIFSTVFHVDKPTGTIPFAVQQRLAADQRVLASYPLAVADSLESYPIIGTTPAYLADQGVGAVAGTLDLARPGDAVLGAEAAARLELKVGDEFQGTHGMIGDEEAEEHAELSYRVVGVLRPTEGPDDAAVYTTYETVWRMHGGDGHHAEAGGGEHEEEGGEHADEGGDKYHLGAGALTAVLVRTASPVYTAALEREWSLEGGTQAVDTGRAIRRLVSYLNKGERLVGVFSAVTLVVAAAMILVTLVMSLAERRKELALLRSLGVGRLTISAVIMIEALVITFAGAALGSLGGHVAVWWAEHPIKEGLGASVEPWVFTSLEGYAIATALIAGQVLALASMVWTYRMNLVEEVARD